jgi:hypothetical protein
LASESEEPSLISSYWLLTQGIELPCRLQLTDAEQNWRGMSPKALLQRGLWFSLTGDCRESMSEVPTSQ